MLARCGRYSVQCRKKRPSTKSFPPGPTWIFTPISLAYPVRKRKSASPDSWSWYSCQTAKTPCWHFLRRHEASLSPCSCSIARSTTDLSRRTDAGGRCPGSSRHLGLHSLTARPGQDRLDYHQLS